MGKVSHKVFNAVVNEILVSLPIMGESVSEVSHFIPEPRNFSEVTRLSADIRKPWLRATLKEIKNLINNQNLLVYIISMHQTEQKLLFYLMLMIVYIHINLRLLENGLWTL